VRGTLLVGRDVELATLEALLADARSGRGRSAVLLGDAGIGKTTLAEAVAELAASRECTVGWGRCPDGEAPPYWAWRQALRGVLGADAEDFFVGADAAGRAELFGSVASALERATSARPATIILEDVHWADASTLALVQFLVGALPGLHLFLVLSARDDPAEMSVEAATALAKLPPAVLRLELSGLDEDATAEVVKSVVGGDAPPDLLTAVHARTAGNPFFATEVARLYSLRGGDVIDVPKGVQQVLTRRLAHLSQDAAEMLAVAAAVGAPDVDVLAAVSTCSSDAVVELLTEAARARLLTANATTFAFAHDLVRETVYEEQSPAIRNRLHRQIAEALEQSGDADPADVAWQWTRAGDQRRAAPYALRAGRDAMASMGYEQAVRYFRWALEGGAGDRSELLLALGESQVLAGQLLDGRSSLAEAAELARLQHRPADAARAVLAMGTGVGGFEVDIADERQRPTLEWAAAELPRDDTPLRAAVLARLSLLLAGRAEHDPERVSLAREAIDVGRRSGDARAEVSALAALVDALAGPDYVDSRLETSARMAELARRVDDAALLLLARRMHLVALLEKGRLREVDGEIEAYARAAERLRLPLYSWPVALWRGMRSLMDGDIEAAGRYADETLAIGDQADSENARIMAFTLRLGIALLVGPPPGFAADIEAAYDAWLGDLPEAYDWAPAAWFALVGSTERARGLVRARLAAGIEELPRDSEWLEMMWQAGEAGRLIDEPEAVELAYDAMQPYADLWVVDGIGGACYGVAAFQLGRLAQYLGRRDEATRWLSTALDAHRREGAHLLIRLTEEALADVGDGTQLATPGAPSASGEFRRAGRLWHLAWRGETATVPDSKGMRDLATLLSTPGREIAAVDLVEAAAGQPVTAGADTGPQLDSRAREEYRRRLADLEEELAEAEDNADGGRVEVLSEERDFLVAELAGALGLGGRPRTTGDPVERARKAVTMRVGTALKGVAEVHPALARHLRASVSTGRFCSYQPEDPVAWQL